MSDRPPAALGAISASHLRVASGGTFGVRNVWCVGRNYRAHAIEMGTDPDRTPPLFFAKPTSAATCGDQTVPYPPRTTELHHEVELVVAIGVPARDVAVATALTHVFGYAVGIDLTRRCAQRMAKQRGHPWALAKGFDASGPCSELVPAADFEGAASARITLAVNGAMRQSSALDQLIWSVPEVVAELSTLVTLQPGDLIFTGTPAGVGAVSVGDSLRAEIAGLTTLLVEIGPPVSEVATDR